MSIELFDAGNALIGSYATLKQAVDAANADAGTDFTIEIGAGSEVIGGSQVVIDKNLSIIGAGMASTTLLADFNTAGGSSLNPLSSLILVNAGKTLDLSGFTLDGNNQSIWHGIKYFGTGVIDQVHFDDIHFDTYFGVAVTAREGADVDITNSEFTDIGRVSAHYFGATGTVDGNTFTGNGVGDHLDYAVEAGAGANIDVTNNIVTGNLGVASDGSTSAAFLVTDYFGPGTTATFSGNTVTNSTAGVAGGYSDTDASVIDFGAGNDFTGNVTDGFVATGVQIVGDIVTTGTSNVDGTFDWYGGPGANAPSGSNLTDTLRGGEGNDTLTGFGGNDTLIGGDGTDTAHYTTTLSAANFSYDAIDNQWVVDAGSGGEGTDKLSGIEKVTDGGSHTFLLVDPAGSYTSIQAAVDAASDGDTILVAAGDYTSEGRIQVVGKSVTVVGALADKSPLSDADWATPANRTIIEAFQVYGPGAALSVNGVALESDSQPTGGDPFSAMQVYGTTGAISVVNSTVSVTSVDFFICGLEIGYGVGDVTVDNVVFSDFNRLPGSDSNLYSAYGVYLNYGASTDRDVSITNSKFDLLDSSDALLRQRSVGVDGYQDSNGGFAVQGNEFVGEATDGAGGGTALRFFDFGNIVNAPPNLTGISGNTFTDSNESSANIDNNDAADGTLTVVTTGANTSNGVAYAQMISGTSGADTITGGASDDLIAGNGGADIITGGAGNDSLSGGAGTDTAHYTTTLSAANFSYDAIHNQWVVDASGGGEGTDKLSGIEKVTDGGGHTFLLVDLAGSYTSIQDAIDAASGGEAILIAPGTYVESGSDGIGHTVGLYINKPNLTLQGYSSVDGSMITSAGDAQANGPTVISGHQTGFGANHWVDVGGTNTSILGLHLQAGPETDNKLLEIWADNVTVQNSFIDVYEGGVTYTFAAAIYFNDNGNPATDNITKYTIDHNILNEGIIVANGVGAPGSIGANQQITNNTFEGHFDSGTGEGRYDTVVINGEVAGIAWLLEPTQTPTISGNTFGDNSTPFLMRGSDNDAANLPTSAQIQTILNTNGDTNTTYAYVVDTTTGDLVTALRNDGAGDFHSFAVTNTIDTLNLALDTTPDHVYGGQREYIHDGDTIIVQSGASGTVNSNIMVDNLTVQATANSADLNLTLATQLVDGTPIAGGGVHNVTLADHAPGSGANVDVTGNALANVIKGNSGDNVLSGLGGADTLKGGGGADSLDGGGDTDTAFYTGVIDVSMLSTNLSGGWTMATGGAEGTDTLTDIEIVATDSDPILLVGNGGFTTIQEAIDAAADGDTILIAAGTYVENLTVNKAVTILGANYGVAGDGARGAETVIQGQTIVNASGPVHIDGVEVLNTSNNTTQFIGIKVSTSSDVQIANSVFYSNGVNGNVDDRAIELNTTATGHVTVEDNLITGAAIGKFGASASWHRGIWSDGAASELDITGNTFQYVRTGINLDGYNNATTDVSGNAFKTAGTAISIGSPTGSTVTGIHDNTFQDADTDFNLRNVTSDQSLNLTSTNNTAIAGGIDAAGTMYVLGGAGADTLTGTSSNDILDARDITGGLAFTDTANNVLSGLGGNDILIGSLGNDTLTGGAGDDVLIGGGGNDTFVYTDASDSPASDVINDFVQGSDKIDLIAFRGVTDLVWSGTTPGAAWGVWYSTGGGNTDVYVDTTGDGTADMHIQLVGEIALTVADFLGVGAVAPVATDDRVITNVGLNFTFNIPTWALLANDTDADGGPFPLSITAVGSAVSGIAGLVVPNVTFKDTGIANGSFDYTLSDGSLTDTGHVTVTQDAGTMNGVGNNNEIFIGNSSGTTINANGGNDIVFGNGGNDNISGGDGNDIALGDGGKDCLSGGAGNDYLDGGTGNDNLSGGDNDDTLVGGTGNDDIFFFFW